MLGDKPLIGHSIQYAQQNGLKNIIVTTNDLAIQEYSKSQDIKIIERPEKLAGNEEPVITALQHVVKNISHHYEYIILLQPTNPLRPEYMLQEALQIIESRPYDSLMTVSQSPKKLGKINSHVFTPYNYTMGQRSQDIEPLYYENGLLYIIRVDLIRQGMLLGENNYSFIIDHPFAEIDIDTLSDFKKAELYLKYFKSIKKS